MGSAIVESEAASKLATAKVNTLLQAYGQNLTTTSPNTNAYKAVADLRTVAADFTSSFEVNLFVPGEDVANTGKVPFQPSADYWFWANNKAFTNETDSAGMPYSIIGRLYKTRFVNARTLEAGYTTGTSYTFTAIDGVKLSNARVSDALARMEAVETAFKANADAFFAAMNANPDTIINSVANKLISTSNANRDREIAKMQRNFTVANGFFNTNINRRVMDINSQYQLDLNKQLGDLTADMYRVHKQLSLGVIQALAGFQNKTLSDQLETSRVGFEMLRSYYVTALANTGATTDILGKGWAYAQAQAQKFLFNSQQKYGAVANHMKWEAEYLQALANTAGQRQDSGNPFMQALLGAGMIAAGAAATTVSGGALAPLTAPLVGAGATTLGGAFR